MRTQLFFTLMATLTTGKTYYIFTNSLGLITGCCLGNEPVLLPGGELQKSSLQIPLVDITISAHKHSKGYNLTFYTAKSLKYKKNSQQNLFLVLVYICRHEMTQPSVQEKHDDWYVYSQYKKPLTKFINMFRRYSITLKPMCIVLLVQRQILQKVAVLVSNGLCQVLKVLWQATILFPSENW